MVRESLSQATEILDNFRNYYKGHILQRIEVDPVKVVDLAFSELEITDNIALIREATDVSHIYIDPSKMAIAIRNLLKNAIEAMPEGGKLVVEIIDKKNNVEIIISDTGVGVSPELNEVIYTPFMAERKNGRGLGIPTAKRIIESHGGELSYESEVGKGSIFTIMLPALR
jgi:signal transduction histidine kinase